MWITRVSRRGVLALAAGAAMTFAAGGASALTTADAETFVKGVVEDLRKLIDDDRKGPEGAAEFLSLLERKAALDAVGKFAIGRTWRDMNESQQAAYLKAFRSFISNTYQNRFDEYNGEDVKVGGAIDAGAKGVLVKSTLVRPNNKPIAIEWLVTDRTGAPLLADITFEGVSLAVTLRENFGSVLEKNQGDVDKFIAELNASTGA